MTAESPALAAWLERLERFSPHEIELGLERVSAVLERLAPALPDTVLTVGGTNGKGSTVACLHALLESGGYRCGAYTSPHVRVYNERIRLHDRLAADEEIIAAFDAVEAVRGDAPLTYFEYGTLAALQCFASAGLDAVVLEVGLGGRLDAVNAVEPTASLITNVALDHCDWLGDTIPMIAREKAGILRPGKPAVFAGDPVPDVIVDHAARIGADLRLPRRDYRFAPANGGWRFEGRKITLNGLERPALPGDYQLANAAGALALLDAAGFEQMLTPELVNRALSGLSLPGRMQLLDVGGQAWLFDVAHNPAAAEALASAVRADAALAPAVGIIGIMQDKDIDAVLSTLDGLVGHWITVTAESARALPAAELAERVHKQTSAAAEAAGTVDQAIALACRYAGGAPVLVTGSFFTVGPVQRALGL